MKLYIYKGPEPNLFSDLDNLFVPVFLFPKSANEILKETCNDYIYVYKENPTKEIVEINKIKKCIALDDISDKEPFKDLKKDMKNINFWRAVAFF